MNKFTAKLIALALVGAVLASTVTAQSSASSSSQSVAQGGTTPVSATQTNTNVIGNGVAGATGQAVVSNANGASGSQSGSQSSVIFGRPTAITGTNAWATGNGVALPGADANAFSRFPFGRRL